jgi:hypothetical protein
MIRNSSKRMTVAQLKQRVDKRFNAVDKRFDEVGRRFDDLEARVIRRIDIRFESISHKLDSIAISIDLKLKHHTKIVGEHEARLKELEGRHRPL